MKRFFLLIILVFTLIGTVSAAEGAETERPTIGLHMVLLGSWCPIGLGVEYFLGPVGLSAQFTTLIWGSDGDYAWFYEPAIGARAYFSKNTDNAFYAGVSGHYCGMAGGSDGSFDSIDANVIRINGLVGFNLLMGEENKGRLAFEIGPRYNIATNTSTSDQADWFFIHFQLIVGRVW